MLLDPQENQNLLEQAMKAGIKSNNNEIGIIHL